MTKDELKDYLMCETEHTAVSTTTNQTTWSNMKTYFVYTSMSGEEHRIDVEEFMKDNGYTDIVRCKRNLMMWIGINKHFEEL